MFIRHHYVSDHHERIEFLFLAGWKYEAIADEIGFDRGSVIRHLKLLGLPSRLPSRSHYIGQRRLDMWPWIFRWIRAGHAIEEIKKALGYRTVIYKNREM